MKTDAFEKVEISISCPTHGDYTQQMLEFSAAKYRKSGKCPKCVAEAEERERAEREERERQEWVEAVMKRAGVPRRFWGHRLGTLTRTHGNATALDEAGKMISDLKSGPFLIMSGGVGTGKTQIAAAIIREAASRGVSGKYARVTDMQRAIRMAYSSNELSEQQQYDQFAQAGLLVLDEFGTKGLTEHEYAQVFDVLDRRYGDMLPTILITNLRPQDFKQAFGERILDRFAEVATFVVLQGESMRGKK